MNEPVKLIVALAAPASEARSDFAAWARSIAAGEAVHRAELEIVDEDAQRAHTRKPLRYFAFVSLWLGSDALDECVRLRPAATAWFRVRERIAFDRSARSIEARPWAGIKKTTPWAPVDGVDAPTWQARYTNHGLIAQAYHATCVRYRQNVVLDGSDEAIGAVSELWWTNVEDLVERFYRSAEAEQLVYVDTLGFVDAARAFPTVTADETLRVSDPATMRGTQ